MVLSPMPAICEIASKYMQLMTSADSSVLTFASPKNDVFDVAQTEADYMPRTTLPRTKNRTERSPVTRAYSIRSCTRSSRMEGAIILNMCSSPLNFPRYVSTYFKASATGWAASDARECSGLPDFRDNCQGFVRENRRRFVRPEPHLFSMQRRVFLCGMAFFSPRASLASDSASPYARNFQDASTFYVW